MKRLEDKRTSLSRQPQKVEVRRHQPVFANFGKRRQRKHFPIAMILDMKA
jgi:hypothetical protein